MSQHPIFGRQVRVTLSDISCTCRRFHPPTSRNAGRGAGPTRRPRPPPRHSSGSSSPSRRRAVLFPLTFSIGNVGSEGVPHMSHQAALSVVRPRFWPPAMITHDITRASGCCQSQTRRRNDIIGRSRRLFFHMVILGLARSLLCLVSFQTVISPVVVLIALDPSWL